jgi:hypothetical protein
MKRIGSNFLGSLVAAAAFSALSGCVETSVPTRTVYVEAGRTVYVENGRTTVVEPVQPGAVRRY